MKKTLLASKTGSKNGSANIFMNGKEVYKIYHGRNLVYDVENGRDFDYTYNYQDQKFTFTNWKGTINGVPNTTDLIIPDDNTIIYNIFYFHTNTLPPPFIELSHFPIKIY